MLNTMRPAIYETEAYQLDRIYHEAKRAAKRAAALEYRIGWYKAACGGRIEACENDSQRRGWWARKPCVNNEVLDMASEFAERLAACYEAISS